MYKKITVFFSILILILSCKSSQKTVESETIDQNKTVHWFYVYIGFSEIEQNLIQYRLKSLNSTPIKGSLKKYDYDLWNYLSEGSKFAVGPFNRKEEAEEALTIYKRTNRSNIHLNEYDPDAVVYWFVLNVQKRERSGSYELVRIPGAVASGTYKEFEVFLRDNLKIGVMTVGPFQFMTDAEESKRIYRLH